MYARVELEAASERQALLVPRDAVHVTGERAMVFVRDAQGALHARNITTGVVAGADVEVISGLRAGEEIVSSAAFLVDAEASMGAGGAMAEMEM
jgi:Cu(I)/Ag(I) efflux system membrane fusion protein